MNKTQDRCWNCNSTSFITCEELFTPTFKKMPLKVLVNTTVCDSCGLGCMSNEQLDNYLRAIKTAYKLSKVAYRLKKTIQKGSSK